MLPTVACKNESKIPSKLRRRITKTDECQRSESVMSIHLILTLVTLLVVVIMFLSGKFNFG